MATNLEYRKQVLWCRSGEKRIYGVAILPAAQGVYPLIVFSHELGNSHRAGFAYAKRLAAAGYAVYTFDFCGGTAAAGRSDGKTTEMTVSTEADDLTAVLAAARTWEFADPARIVLLGGSQGGVVSALVALCKPDDVAGLILLYPAFSAPDHMRRLFSAPDEIPAEFEMFGGWMRLGRDYALELWDRDFYADLAGCGKKVLLLHGDADETVPLRYSQRAAAVLPHCEFHVIPGGGHVFSGPPLETAAALILSWLKALF